MKRPVTSLCRRPGKKTACGAACPRCGNNSHPQGRSAEVKRSCRAKAARTRAQKQPRRGPGTVHRLRHGGTAGNGVSGAGKAPHWAPAGAEGMPGRKNSLRQGRRLSGCGIWVLLAPGDPCDLDAQGGQHSQAEDHAQLSQGEICHQEQAMQSGDQQHSQEQQHAHAEGSQ